MASDHPNVSKVAGHLCHEWGGSAGGLKSGYSKPPAQDLLNGPCVGARRLFWPVLGPYISPAGLPK